MHPHMALDIDECIQITHLKNKATAVIPTYSAPLSCLMWSVFALLLRSKPGGVLEHFIVCINGPDKRTGDPTLQDQKQAFLEDLRKLKWGNKDMPVTVIRAWSRVGHPETIEMAMPWIHTDAYLLMHDDVIVARNEWEQDALDHFWVDPEVIMAHGTELLASPCDHAIAHGLYLLRLPSLHSTFLLCRKSLMRKIGASWLVFNLGGGENTTQFDLHDEVGDVAAFLNYYKAQGLINKPPQTLDSYNFATFGFGAWVYYNLKQHNYKTAALNKANIVHLGAMTVGNEQHRTGRIQANRLVIETLEAEINAHSDYGPLYRKYLKS